MQRFLHRFILPTLIVLLSACNGIGIPPKPVAIYDLGLIASRSLPADAVPSRIQFLAPTWLEVSAMQYRLEWDQPLRRRAFADSRWAAKPPEMLARALDRAVRSNGTATSECRLRIELDEFIQIFEAEDRSKVELVARASWLPARSEAALARKEFRLSQPADPTAEGGVAAYRELAAQFSDQLALWLSELDPPRTQALNKDMGCRA
ncbi:MAG: ABC-type transport auxiliary lipoprotein family protein [Azoarcus sp.]|nr:ABC-type transport auxiliary lipoprotein family protein [Azoarcus sp.]